MVSSQLFGVRLPPEMHLKFKILCTLEGVQMSDVTRDLIASWIAEREENPGLAEQLRSLINSRGGKENDG